MLVTQAFFKEMENCLLYTSDAADEEDSVDLGGCLNIKKKKKMKKKKKEVENIEQYEEKIYKQNIE